MPFPPSRDILEKTFWAMIDAARPEYCLPAYLPCPPKGRTVVIGAGKGVAQYARYIEKNWDAPLSGVVVTRYGMATDAGRIQVLEAAHPIPDQQGVEAVFRIQQAVSALGADDLVIALICGGGSALLPAPPQGLSLNDEITVSEILLSSGIPIAEMNSIRTALSTIKGGQLGLSCAPAKLVSLIVSDVAGDRVQSVASGPTVPQIDFENIEELIQRRGLKLPENVMTYLRTQSNGKTKKNLWLGMDHQHHIVASAQKSLHAAKMFVHGLGIGCKVISDAIEGDAMDIADQHAVWAKAEEKRPFMLLSGGESTVFLSKGLGQSKGGPNSACALALAKNIANTNIHALIADTDGIDGIGDHAGAFVDGGSMQRLFDAGIDWKKAVACHESYLAFQAIDGLFHTGATGTNINDFRALYICP